MMLCFPYAGGTAETFAGWIDLARPELDISAVRLPGRSIRLREPAIESMARLMDDMGPAIAPSLPTDYYLFGNCLGGLLAYEFARWISGTEFPKPRRLFICGCGAPSTETASKLIDASDAELVAQLRRWEGMTEEALANPQIVAMALPSLRADLRLLAGYSYDPSAKIAVPITTFRGTRDATLAAEAVNEWQQCTTAAFRYRELDGGHFPDPKLLIAALRDELDSPEPS